MKAWRSLLLVAAFVACVPFTASADDVVVAQINGVDIKQSDLDFAASEVGAQLANFPPEDRRRMLLQFVMENELMAEAATKAGLDSGQSFEDRLKYHRRRALRDAYFDKSVRNAVPDEEAKKVYDAKVAGMKPEEEIHARHILVKIDENQGEAAAGVGTLVQKEVGIVCGLPIVDDAHDEGEPPPDSRELLQLILDYTDRLTRVVANYQRVGRVAQPVHVQAAGDPDGGQGRLRSGNPRPRHEAVDEKEAKHE